MPVGEPWTDDELRAALEAYLFVSRLDDAGLVIPEAEFFDLLQRGPLPGRNSTSIRYRMRNISAVFQDLGRPTVPAYPPATKVGTGVQARIEAMLDQSPQKRALSSSRPSSKRPGTSSAGLARAKAKRALNDLADALDELDPSTPGIGHNQPPEAIGEGVPIEELRRAINTVEELRKEIASSHPRVGAIISDTGELARSGVLWAAWFRGRGTKAVDAAINTIVPAGLIALAALTFNAVVALLNLIPHLPWAA